MKDYRSLTRRIALVVVLVLENPQKIEDDKEAEDE